MQDSLTKEKILKKIRAGLIEKTPNPFPKLDTEVRLFDMQDTERELVFAKAFTDQGGHFLFNQNHLDFVEDFLGLCEAKKWKQFYCLEKNISSFLTELEFSHINTNDHDSSAEVLITNCECLIARTGTLVFSSKQAAGKILTAKAKVLILLANVEQLVDDIKDAMHLIKVKHNGNYPSEINLVSGPFTANASAENNTEHFKEVYLFLIDSNDMLKLSELKTE
jgi:L-lactate dehydrogenase complex protein LldG